MSQIKIKRGAVGYAKGYHHGHTKHVVACIVGGRDIGIAATGSRRQCFAAVRKAFTPGVAFVVRRPLPRDKPVDA